MTITADDVVRAELQELVWMDLARESTPYFLNWVKCVDSRTGEIFQFQMLTKEEAEEFGLEYHGNDWYWQREYLDWVEENDETVTLKGRQLGVTWVWGGRALKTALFKPGADVLVYSIKEQDASEVINRIWEMWLSVPQWMKNHLGVRVLKPSRNARPTTEIVFEHKDGRVSTITGMAATKSAGHGRSAAMILFDEASRQEYARELWSAVIPAIADSGGVIGVVSTANGMSSEDAHGNVDGNFFHELWIGAGEAEYPSLKTTFLGWDKHPDRDEEWYRGLSMPAKKKAEQYPNDPDEAFLMSGSPYFDVESLYYYAREATIDPILTFDWIEHKIGAAKMAPKADYAYNRVYHKPKPGHHYAIGADVATGRGKDYSCAYVIDLSNMEICAQLHGKLGADQFALQLHYLGRWYNDARLAVEIGGGYGEAVIIPLRDGLDGRPPYPNLYRHRQETRIDKPGAKQIGFPMTMKTRPVVLSQLEQAIRDRDFDALPAPLVKECQMFVYADTVPSPRAQDGANDDRVMAAAIALEMYRRFGTHPDRWKPDKVEQEVSRRVRVDTPRGFARRYGKAR